MSKIKLPRICRTTKRGALATCLIKGHILSSFQTGLYEEDFDQGTFEYIGSAFCKKCMGVCSIHIKKSGPKAVPIVEQYGAAYKSICEARI